MLVIDKKGKVNIEVNPFAYACPRGLLGRIMLHLTRLLRAVNAEKYIKPARRHLDIGCGDGYLLKRSKCEERIGLDRLVGDDIEKKLDLPDGYFDYVTLLSVIEHLRTPEGLMREVARVLKPGGIFIISTPVRLSDYIIRVYARGMKEQHAAYYDSDAIRALAGKNFILVGGHRFMLGFNQVFVLKKNQGNQ